MNLRQAINDKCRECIYDKHSEGNWRQQVTACSSFKCPLFQVRPTTLSVEKGAILPPESTLESTIFTDPVPTHRVDGDRSIYAQKSANLDRVGGVL